MSPAEDARPNREQAARGGRGAASSFWPPKGRRHSRRDRGPLGGGHMPCESWEVTLPSDVSRRAKVTPNWGSPSGRRAGNPGPGRVSREQAEGRERAASRSRKKRAGALQGSGAAVWSTRMVPGDDSDESGDEQLRSMIRRRAGPGDRTRPTPGDGRGANDGGSRPGGGGPGSPAARQGRTGGAGVPALTAVERLRTATPILWGGSTRERGEREHVSPGFPTGRRAAMPARVRRQ